MAVWLDDAQVRAVIGADLSGGVPTGELDVWADAAAEFVEKQRADLFNAETPPVFVPTPSVLAGAAMLAYRWHTRRTSPLGMIGPTEDGSGGMLRHDPDIARMLGIGPAGPFVFAAALPAPDEGAS